MIRHQDQLSDSDDNSMEQTLTKLGLSETEARIYLAALSAGPSTAAVLAGVTKTKRPTTYLNLENLIKLGLIVESTERKKKLFKAVAPEKLEKLTKKMRRQVIAAELELEKLMPELKSMRKKILESPQVTVHRGLSGVKNIIEEFMESTSPWSLFGSSESILGYLAPHELQELVLETNELRARAGKPKARLITDKGILKIKQFQRPNFAIREIKILDKPIKATSAFVMYGSKVAVFSINDSPFGITFESEEVAEMLKVMYAILWDSLPQKPV